MTYDDPQEMPPEEDAASPETGGPQPRVVRSDAQEPQGPAVEQQIADLKDRLLRSLAEAENMRRRAERERDDAAKYAVANFARDVVGVADNLRRALDSAKNPGESENAQLKALMGGVEVTERGLLGTLERHGIKAIEAMGQKFNANLHQAIYELPGSGKEPGTVVQVVQQGFTIAGRLLRPAMVGVAKGDGGPRPASPKPDPESKPAIDASA